MLLPVVVALVGAVGIFKVLQQIRIGKRTDFNGLHLFNRPLSLLERWYAGFEPPRMFSESLVVDGPAPELSHVIEIVKVLCARFPILTASLKFSPTMDPSYVKLDMPKVVEFPVRIEKRESGEWEKLITEEIHKFFTPRVPDTPMWRMVIAVDPSSSLSRFSVVVTFHHIVADGLSGTIFMKHFMQIHNDLQAGKTPNKDEIKALVMEDIIDVRPTLTHLLYEIFQAFSPVKNQRQDYLGPPEKNTKLSTHAYYMKLGEDVLVPLREACKREKVTLHGALCAALMFAANAAKNAHSAPEKELSLTYPTSLRKLVPKKDDPNYMGLCLCGVTMKNIFIDDSSLFWYFARRVNAEAESLQKSATAKVGMLNFIPGTMDQFVNVVKNKGLPNNRDASVELSNLGMVDFSSESQNDWIAKELYFAIPNHISGPVFCNSCATVGSTLILVTTVADPVLPYEEGEKFQQFVRQCLVASSTNPSLAFSDLKQ